MLAKLPLPSFTLGSVRTRPPNPALKFDLISGINGGLRRMSDLETPEADMMRDHSSLDAAPATLRLEELRPGLDPDNPGAAPDTTLDLVAVTTAVPSPYDLEPLPAHGRERGGRLSFVVDATGALCRWALPPTCEFANSGWKQMGSGPGSGLLRSSRGMKCPYSTIQKPLSALWVVSAPSPQRTQARSRIRPPQ